MARNREPSKKMLDHAERVKAIDVRYGLFRTIARWVGAVGVTAFVWLCIREIAGKDTSFAATVNSIVKWQADRWIFAIVSVVLAGGWWVERRTRQRTIGDHARYISDLERARDPDRSSSGLTSTGEPIKEDRDAV